MKIVISIFVSGDFEKLKEKMKTAKLKGADAVELRADSYAEIGENDLSELKEISKKLRIPVIFTLRSKEEGGKNGFSFENKLKLTKKALALNFDYIDIELKFLEELGDNVPDLKGKSKAKIILSEHDFKEMDAGIEKLRKIKKRMADLKPDVMKIAVLSKGKKTNGNILKLIKETKEDGKNIIGIAMGQMGKEARLKAIQDNYFSYFSLNEKEKTAPGQISLEEFKNGKRD